MRHKMRLLALVSVLCGLGVVPASANVTLTPTVGFNGYYRPDTLTPVAVHVRNDGDDLHGEFTISSENARALPHRYRYAMTIPRGANALHHFYIVPRAFTRSITVAFRSQGRQVVEATFSNCQELHAQDRLLVILGGTGSTLSFANGHPINTPNAPAPRSWDTAGMERWREMRYRSAHTSGSTTGPSGNLRLVHLDRTLLPDNPEAYGSVTMLALMSDMTEGMVPAGAQRALPQWAEAGGHLLLAGGGVPARLDALFFTGLLASVRADGEIEQVGNTDGGRAITARFGRGRVTLLDYDPDTVVTRDWQKTAEFYGALLAREAEVPLTLSLQETLARAVGVRDMQPPSLGLIVIYLVVYLVLLVPVNYLVLRKLDRREFAWITTPLIVLVFTLGAYSIGYMMKGNRLVLNVATVVETVAEQPTAMAVSHALIFSPSRSRYRMDLGEEALLAHEAENRSRRGETEGSRLTFTQTRGQLSVDGIAVNMWDFRQFAAAHRLDMGGGIAASLQGAAPGAMPRATGTITNRTPYHFVTCALYYDGVFVSGFPLAPGETVDVALAAAQQLVPSLEPGAQHVYATIHADLTSQFTSSVPLSHGFVLVGYTTEIQPVLRLDRQHPTAALALVAVRL